jgi:AsmA protein
MPAELPLAWIKPMARSPRIIVLAAVGLLGLLVLVAAAVLYFLADTNKYKTWLESTASGALGMEVSIGGRVGIDFFPGVLVTLEDVRVRNRTMDVASAKEARLEIELFPLLQKDVRIEQIALTSPKITVERDRDGQFNFESPGVADQPLTTRDWPNVTLSDGTLVYADKRFAEGFEAGHCRLDVHRLRLSGGKRSGILKDLSLTAELTCGEVRSKGFTVSDLKFSTEAKNGVFDLEPVTLRVFGTQGSASIRADFSGVVPRYHVRYSLLQFPIEEFFKLISPRTVAAGRMDFSSTLSLQGKTVKEMLPTVTGKISLQGKNLTLTGNDLDREFSRFESSQNFNLVDVGAFFFAGPVGLLVTKGYNFSSIFRETGGSSEIETLVSEWGVERGVAQAQDVAMATKENRVALQGGLDFVNDQFNDVTMALIDAKGCAKVRQKIRGSFEHPVVENPSVLKSLTGPALSLLKKGSDLLLGKQCKVFYAGSVAAPK